MCFIIFLQLEAEETSTAVRKSVEGIQKAFKSYPILSLPDPGKGVKKKCEEDHITLNCK